MAPLPQPSPLALTGMYFAGHLPEMSVSMIGDGHIWISKHRKKGEMCPPPVIFSFLVVQSAIKRK